MYETEFRAKIEKEIEVLVRTAFPRDLNHKIMRFQRETIVGDFAVFDWRIAYFSESAIEDNQLIFGLKGFRSAFEDEGHSETVTKD